MELTNRLAVITGATGRIGRAVVEAVAKKGAIPVIHYASNELLAKHLAQTFGGCSIQADFNIAGQSERLIDAIVSQQKDVALWVNCASHLERVRFLESTETLWETTFRRELFSLVTFSRSAPALMRKGGLIVNFLDAGSSQPLDCLTHHSAVKSSVWMLTRALAVELAPHIRVCGVSPGIVMPAEEPNASTPWQPLLSRIPLGRPGNPEDIANAILFLVESDYITGSIMTVDGGLGCRPPFQALI